jgi:hypothetical protein
MSHLLICQCCGHKYESKRSDSKTCSKNCRKALSRGGYKGARTFLHKDVTIKVGKEPTCEVCHAEGKYLPSFAYSLQYCLGLALCRDCNRKGYFFHVKNSVVTIRKRLSRSWYEKNFTLEERLILIREGKYPYDVIGGGASTIWE